MIRLYQAQRLWSDHLGALPFRHKIDIRRTNMKFVRPAMADMDKVAEIARRSIRG